MPKVALARRAALARRKVGASTHNLSAHRTMVVVGAVLLATAMCAASAITASASAPRSPGLQQTVLSQTALVDQGQAVGLTPRPGYTSGWVAYQSGAVVAYGGAPYLGSASARSAPVVGIAATPTGKGYWLVTANRPGHRLRGRGQVLRGAPDYDSGRHRPQRRRARLFAPGQRRERLPPRGRCLLRRSLRAPRAVQNDHNHTGPQRLLAPQRHGSRVQLRRRCPTMAQRRLRSQSAARS